MRPFRAFVAKLRGPLERMLDARAADEPYCGLCCCDVADHPVHYWTVGDDGQFAERFCGTPVPSSVSSAIEEEANAARRRNGERAAQTVEDIRAGLLHGAWDDREWLCVVSLRSDLPDDVRALVEKAKQALGGVTP